MKINHLLLTGLAIQSMTEFWSKNLEDDIFEENYNHFNENKQQDKKSKITFSQEEIELLKTLSGKEKKKVIKMLKEKYKEKQL